VACSRAPRSACAGRVFWSAWRRPEGCVVGWPASRLVELLLAFPLCVVVFFWPSSPRSSTSRNLPPMPATPRKWSSTLFRPATLTTSSSFSPANTGSATVDNSFVDGLESLSIHSVHPPPVSTPCGSRGRATKSSHLLLQRFSNSMQRLCC